MFAGCCGNRCTECGGLWQPQPHKRMHSICSFFRVSIEAWSSVFPFRQSYIERSSASFPSSGSIDVRSNQSIINHEWTLERSLIGSMIRKIPQKLPLDRTWIPPRRLPREIEIYTTVQNYYDRQMVLHLWKTCSPSKIVDSIGRLFSQTSGVGLYFPVYFVAWVLSPGAISSRGFTSRFASSPLW